ncbi:STAS domain-containing protein [Blastococcus tunisiensis]|uniref:Stage II sporulation protein AA (Anti-sigma F factor antagonist) n=1 Tax=Blastococcus tunisiensis TaxID=1798228 RepID=A0A1I2LAJ5_9ACTN|nr:STAS domain-containing protein [Blastococcus sp. DSM 46838]SFF76314.1 stage II sporulation protein AA (anti-sigma F factor antagonist) [Blastococcus sp. DSM 46838]
MEETTGPAAGEPEVTQRVEGGVARLSLAGELTETARRPLVRVVTELLLHQPAPTRVELDVSATTFMNSAGTAVLVQLQRLTAPRGIDVVLVHPTPAVVRPLQLSGLWHRFPIEGAATGS